ncbi:hypothetical protein [Psychromicrobium lacuslunae]|uniref:hypothetical protein n=1 Tax=Psychromicrobium lacuslunae TaxID=1618207 RepID=UPI000698DC02|nr:hypothetical protein [Psychromicrobium lacuslunae]
MDKVVGDNGEAIVGEGKMQQKNSSGKQSVGRPALISRATIGEAALAELDGISSTKVAKRLGVAQSSLYRHITDRADLIRLAVDFALANQEWPEPEGNWRKYLLDYSVSFWKFLEKHPGLSQELELMRPSPQSVIDRLTKVAVDLLGFGFSAEDANMAVDLLAHVTISSMITEQIFSSKGRHGTTVRDENRDAWLSQDQRLARQTARSMEQDMYLNLLERVELILDGFEMRLGRKEKATEHSTSGTLLTTTVAISGITPDRGIGSVIDELQALPGVQTVTISVAVEGISTATIYSDRALEQTEIGEAVAEAGFLVVAQRA